MPKEAEVTDVEITDVRQYIWNATFGWTLVELNTPRAAAERWYARRHTPWRRIMNRLRWRVSEALFATAGEFRWIADRSHGLARRC
jgi:hypothetical protein